MKLSMCPKFRTLPVLAGLLGLALVCAGARADQDAPPPAKGEPVSMAAYGVWNVECLEWTNGCAVCQRQADGTLACSTPGVACQPKGIVCRRRLAAPVTKPEAATPVAPKARVSPDATPAPVK